MLLGVFFAGLLAYALASRVLDGRSVTPQLWLLGLGILVGLIADASTLTLDHELLKATGEVALILCLFVDAARIDVAALRGTAGLPIRLLAVGLPLTIVAGVGAALAVLPGVGFADALLLAILVAPTDAALGAVVVSSPAVPLRIRQALNVESGLNDGLVTPLVLVAVALGAAGAGSSSSGWLVEAVGEIALGTGSGLVVGVGGGALLRGAMRRGWALEGAHWMTAPAMAFLAWVVADAVGGNAFVAAFVAGLATTATLGRVPGDAIEFAEVGGELLGLAVFFLLGVLVPSLDVLQPMVVVFALLALTVVRMVPVALSLVGTGLARPTVAFIGWFGPRGLASVVLAILALDATAADDAAVADVVLDAVLLTVILSVVAHGLTAGPAVRWYQQAVHDLPSDAPEHEATTVVRPRGRALDQRIRTVASSGMEDGPMPTDRG